LRNWVIGGDMSIRGRNHYYTGFRELSVSSPQALKEKCYRAVGQGF